jgi:CHAD domain-containing protein
MDPTASLHLLRSEPPLRGLARISRVMVRELAANAPDQSLEDRVHDARVTTKKLRAYSLLLRPATGEAAFRALQAPLREASQALSTHRDLDVAATTLDLLGNRVGKRRRPLFRDAARKIAKLSQNPKWLHGKRHALAQLERALASASEELAASTLRQRGWPLLGPGYALTYRQCRKRFRRFRESGQPEAAHALRKRVKSLGFQVALLEAANPDAIARLRAELKDLGHQLGLLHDCTVLVELIDSKALRRRIPAADRKKIRAAARDWEAKLTRECQPLAEQLFASTPEEFTSQLERDWRRWRVRRPATPNSDADGR